MSVSFFLISLTLPFLSFFHSPSLRLVLSASLVLSVFSLCFFSSHSIFVFLSLFPSFRLEELRLRQTGISKWKTQITETSTQQLQARAAIFVFGEGREASAIYLRSSAGVISLRQLPLSWQRPLWRVATPSVSSSDRGGGPSLTGEVIRAELGRVAAPC